MAKWIEDYQVEEKKEPVKEQSLKVEMLMKPIVNESEGVSLPFKEKQHNNMNLLQRNLGNCLQIIDEEVMKGYVTKLEQLPIVQYDKNEISIPDVQLFKITELVYQEDEFSVHKLSSLFHSLTNRPCTVIMMLKSNGNRCDFYLGVRSLNPVF